MTPMYRNKALLGLGLVLLIAWAGAAHGQATKSFTGKITEIARGTQLDVGKSGTFYMVRLEEYPNIEFRLASEDAVRFGVVAAGGPAQVVTSKMSKGLGWKVKLTCDTHKTGSLKNPVYKVISLVRLGD
ncbi:MAG: hypothetical protein Q7O12_03655 [Deltaproteobacteria bacterium]|nr:hypothetical protein [Deltaproteobacteria bacterium]